MLHINKDFVCKSRERTKTRIYSSLSGKDKSSEIPLFTNFEHYQIKKKKVIKGGKKAKLRKVLRG